MAQLVKHLLLKNKDLSSYPQNPLNKESQAQQHLPVIPMLGIPGSGSVSSRLVERRYLIPAFRRQRHRLAR